MWAHIIIGLRERRSAAMVGLFTSYGRVLLFSVVLNRMLCKTRHHISVLTFSRRTDVFCCFILIYIIRTQWRGAARFSIAGATACTPKACHHWRVALWASPPPANDEPKLHQSKKAKPALMAGILNFEPTPSRMRSRACSNSAEARRRKSLRSRINLES